MVVSEHKTGQTVILKSVSGVCRFPEKLSDRVAFQTERETHKCPINPPNYYKILANLFTIQNDMDGDFLTGALLLKCLGGRD